MKYNLFLDDIRYPYITMDQMPEGQKAYHSMVSAYHYTFYKPFKDEYWEIVRSYTEFINVVTKYGVPEMVAFDHDLGIEHYNVDPDMNPQDIDYSKYREKTGYDCAKWLCDYCQDHNAKYPIYYVHSMNLVGSKNISTYIENWKKHVQNS